MTSYGTVEIGGTKTYVAVGTSPADISTPVRITTTTPSETLGSVTSYLRDHRVDAVGVASFGPLDLDVDSRGYGTVLATPKLHWSGADILGPIRSELDVPVILETDVNGAALGEGRWGATSGLDSFAYMTVGTGIGVGIVVEGRLLRGVRHPEAGHIAVHRHPEDTYDGACPYHGTCLEGLAAGPALEARFGPPDTWAGVNGVLELAAHYVAQGLRSLVYTVAPERIVVGGGVSGLPYFHERLRTVLEDELAGYPVEPDMDLLVAKPGLGDLSGLAGGLVLAERAVS